MEMLVNGFSLVNVLTFNLLDSFQEAALYVLELKAKYYASIVK